MIKKLLNLIKKLIKQIFSFDHRVNWKKIGNNFFCVYTL